MTDLTSSHSHTRNKDITVTSYDRPGVSHYRQLKCFFKSFFKLTPKKTSKHCVTLPLALLRPCQQNKGEILCVIKFVHILQGCRTGNDTKVLCQYQRSDREIWVNSVNTKPQQVSTMCKSYTFLEWTVYICKHASGVLYITMTAKILWLTQIKVNKLTYIITCISCSVHIKYYFLIFLSLDLFSEYRVQHGANGPLYVTSSYSTWIFCRGVSGFATDFPCGVWCRGLTTCLLHVGPPFANRILNKSWAVGLT